MDNCLERLYELLAAELNCSAGDFTKKENVLTVSALSEGRRAYSPERYFFHMATTGRNAVITADERLHSFLEQYKERCEGYLLFTLPELEPLGRELEKYGYRLTETYHMFLPCRRAEPQRDYMTRWFTGEELRQFYGDSRFPNALCPQFTPERPDTAAVCAYDGEEIMGMAGCSEDAKGWQQIGVDVMPQYRSMGVGTRDPNRSRPTIGLTEPFAEHKFYCLFHYTLPAVCCQAFSAGFSTHPREENPQRALF